MLPSAVLPNRSGGATAGFLAGTTEGPAGAVTGLMNTSLISDKSTPSGNTK